MKKILIIEDEILILNSLKSILQKKGCSVDCQTKGQDAIKSIQNNNYDKIICDLMLQDITGFDIIEESKKKYNLEEISSKFIIITAYVSNDVISKAKKYNCEILSKPFENINDAIDKFIS